MNSTLCQLKKAARRGLGWISGEPHVTDGEFNLCSLPHLLGRDDPVIVEIGTNDGEHTKQFLSLFPVPRVYAFEPDPRARRRFEVNLRNRRVNLSPCAVGATDGHATLYLSSGYPDEESKELMPDGWDKSSSIRKPVYHLTRHPWCKFDEQMIVPICRLDTWARLNKVDTVDFIWADVQGAEVDVIEGGKETLKRTRYFYTEYNNSELYEGQVSLRSLLRSLPEFQVVTRYHNDVLLANRAFL